MRGTALLLASLFFFATGGCAGSRSEPMAPAPASPESYESVSPGADAEEPAYSEAEAPTRDRGQERRAESLGGSTSPFAQPPPGTVGSVQPEVWTLFEDFSVAESLALSGQGGCVHACRALRSMTRSAERLCALAREEGEQRMCEDARRRVRQARGVVRSACVRCDGGPDLDGSE